MDHRSSTRTIHAAIMTIVAIVVVSACLISGKLGGTNAVGIAVSARGETGPLVLAQYNPCPNRVCR
jgi:hypothetical protein